MLVSIMRPERRRRPKRHLILDRTQRALPREYVSVSVGRRSVCLSDSRLGMDCIRSNDNQYGIRIVIPGRQTDLMDQIRDQKNCILLVTRSANTYPANKLVRGWLLKGRKRRKGRKKTRRKNPRLFSVLMVFCSQPRRPVPSFLSCT